MLNILIGCASILFLFSACESVSVEEDLTLNYSQKKALDQFRELVSNSLPHDYMKEDIYLIRWLRARNFNLKDAEQMLMQNVAWRQENDMDNIHNEDWSQFKKLYRYWVNGVDKEGRPILLVDVGEWNIRRGVLAGQGPQIGRFIDKALDEVNVKVRSLRSENKTVTQYYHIFDMEGYNLVEQGCPICLPLSIRLVTTYETFFPGNCHKIMLVNTPAVFQSLLQILRPLMTPMTRDSMFIYGRNKKEVQRAFLKDIDKDQLSVDLGGTRILPEL